MFFQTATQFRHMFYVKAYYNIGIVWEPLFIAYITIVNSCESAVSLFNPKMGRYVVSLRSERAASRLVMLVIVVT